MLAIGLMSGTSLDGIDAALVRIEPQGETYKIELLNFITVPFEEDLLETLHGALPPNVANVAVLASLHRRLGTAFGRAAHTLVGALQVDYIASHGQTMWHDGAAHVTTQIGDPFIIRETLNATVCYDFRSADCAVGGHGAPLVPYVDALLFSDHHENRAILNIGGIANITLLPAGVPLHDVSAYDIGPGNMVLDAFVGERTHGKYAMDRDGAFAAAGTVDEDVLDTLLQDEYLALRPPKTTGRERFGSHFLRVHATILGPLSLEDGAATLTEFTVAAIARAVENAKGSIQRLIVSGGGALNPYLMRRLQARLRAVDVETSAKYGIPPEAKEAIAFAMLGYETLRERAANVPRVTGASRAIPLGAIAPVRLATLISEVERECRSL